MSSRYLIWLDWPEKCFRAQPSDIAYFKSLVPSDGEVVRVRSERAFLRELPKATHAVVWRFRSEGFARAPRLSASNACAPTAMATDRPTGDQSE